MLSTSHVSRGGGGGMCMFPWNFIQGYQYFASRVATVQPVWPLACINEENVLLLSFSHHSRTQMKLIVGRIASRLD